MSTAAMQVSYNYRLAHKIAPQVRRKTCRSVTLDKMDKYGIP